MNNKLWFKAKSFGWGWQPITWQGWILTLLYIFAMFGYVLHANRYTHSSSDALFSIAIPFVALTVPLLIICYLKGEKPEWRWNGK